MMQEGKGIAAENGDWNGKGIFFGTENVRRL